MSRFRCRRDHCDNLTTVYGGLCQFHASPPDLELDLKEAARWRRRDPEPDPYYAPDAFADDVPGMSSTEKYLYGENE